MKHSPLRLSSNSYQPGKNLLPSCDTVMRISIYVLTRCSIQARSVSDEQNLKRQANLLCFIKFHLSGQVAPKPIVSVE